MDDSIPDVIKCDIDTIRLDCPIDCLQTVLSAMTFNPLARAYEAPFEPPRTVGDVVGLYSQDKLHEIRGLGPRRIGEIEVALIFAGVVVQQRHSM